MTELVEYNKYLPSYRSLLNPNARYDYKTHLLIPLLQQDINTIVARFQKIQQASKKSAIKMKYRSLLSDVSIKAQRLYLGKLQQQLLQSTLLPQTLAATRPLSNRCVSISQLPVEIQTLVFEHVQDKKSYLNLMCTSRGLYQAARPFFYRSISFTSTYRFAQFVSCLRLNSSLGSYVFEVDLSGIKSGYIEPEDTSEASENDEYYVDEIAELLNSTLAGWRDWKYKNNPLYALHPAPAVPLTKVHSSVSLLSHNSLKRVKLTKYFKRRRSQTEVSIPPLPVGNTITAGHNPTAHIHRTGHSNANVRHSGHPVPHLLNQSNVHPKINKFLLNYAQSKDVPTGYVLHLINMCPNLKAVNLANLTFSTDYRIKLKFLRQYQRYDLMNNFPKEIRRTLDEIASVSQQAFFSPFRVPTLSTRFGGSDIGSSSSSVFSLSTLAKPIIKYNSLLPPLGPPGAELTYLAKGDKTVYLSDVNLRAINAAHLDSCLPHEIFINLSKNCYSLRLLNMSLMIWINLKSVRTFLLEVLAESLGTRTVDGKEHILYNNQSFEVTGDEEPAADTVLARNPTSPLEILDLSNSGMYKSLGWAKCLDLTTYDGQKAIYRILNDEVLTDFEEYILRDRIRRGRPGENYFS